MGGKGREEKGMEEKGWEGDAEGGTCKRTREGTRV